jgi:peptidoglycan/xylan/chitin deacetylase (PgdA/CDA1 family)
MNGKSGVSMFVLFRVSKKTVWFGMVAWCVALVLFLLHFVTSTVKTDAAVSEEPIALPIIMYHGLSLNPAKQGKYVISPKVLEADLQYLKQNGYTTVTMAEVIQYTTQGKPLPEKPIMLTFDDGNYNNYVYAYPLMKQYQSRMVLSPIGEAVDRYTKLGNCEVEYATCHWQHLREMQESGLVELQNHSYQMHSLSDRKGSSKKATETAEQYRLDFTNDVKRMQQRLLDELGKEATTFVYPFGAVSQESVALLKEMGFQATMNCESRVNAITRDSDCLFGLGRYLRTSTPDSATFFQTIFS